MPQEHYENGYSRPGCHYGQACPRRRGRQTTREMIVVSCKRISSSAPVLSIEVQNAPGRWDRVRATNSLKVLREFQGGLPNFPIMAITQNDLRAPSPGMDRASLGSLSGARATRSGCRQIDYDYRWLSRLLQEPYSADVEERAPR